MMSQRRQSRIVAIQILYQIQLTTTPLPSIIEQFWRSQATSVKLRPFATQLVEGTAEHLAVIDDLLQNTSKNWKLHRMPIVDLAILRCATYEILFVDDIDPATSINEAVEIAKSYSTPDSPKFINGVLDNIRKKSAAPIPEHVTLEKNQLSLKTQQMGNLTKLTLCLLFLIPMHLNAAPEFKFVNEFGRKGEGEAQFAETVFMAFGADGAVYITDTDNFRIQKFNENGAFLFNIQMQADSTFRFINPTTIAIGTDGSIYVMDWMFAQVSDLNVGAKVFNYGPCIHKFDAQGAFIASYPIQDVSQRIAPLETAAPGLDAEGNYALIIPQGDTKREFLLTVDTDGNLYVCDGGTIYRLNPEGEPVAHYALAQPGTGRLVHPVDMTADKNGNLYVVDEKGHRVLKYSPDGEFLSAFGEYGDRGGQFIAPFRIAALADGTLLVADTAKYLKDFASTLPKRLDDPTRRYDGGTQLFRYRLRRIQRFTTDGAYTQKLLVPFRREVETEVALHLKGIDSTGNLYYLNPTELVFRKYAPTTPLISSMFQTELKLRYTRDLHDIEIDNQDDLDADLYTKSDFDEQIVQDTAYANLIFSYDLNESLRLALSNRLTYVHMTDTSYYRAREFVDFRGSFNQDDRATENSWDDRIQIDFTWIRDHSLYNYREARAFVYFNVIRLDFVSDALNPANARLFDFYADLSDWGAGLHYDLRRNFRLNFEITHFFGENRYTYIDETNVLYATGFQEANFTRAALFINGIF